MSFVQRGVAYVRGRFSGKGRSVRFLLAGGVNTAFGIGIYPLLMFTVPYFRAHYLVGLIAAQAISLVFAFVSYKCTVFRSRGGALSEFARFLPFYFVNYALNWLGLPLLVHFFHLDPVIAQVGFTVAVIISSYFWHSRVTFRQALTHD